MKKMIKFEIRNSRLIKVLVWPVKAIRHLLIHVHGSPKLKPEALKSCVGRIEAAPYVLRPSKGCFVGAFSTSFTSILTDLWDLIERSNQKSNQPVVHEIKYSMFRRLTRDKERQQHHATPFIWSRASWFHMFLPMQLALQHLSDLCHPRKPMIQSCPS